VSSIRLQNVSKIYPAHRPADKASFVPGGPASHADRAFSERVAAREDLNPAAGGPVAALDDVTLTIDDGTTLAVVGPTGCGKSTLLRVVAGLEDDFTGRVFYDDRDVTGVPVRDRHIGMVFQSYALYPHFEGQGNLAFYFKVRHAPDEEAEERIRVTAEVMGIGFRELLGRKPGKLSGGQQQRLAIGRAIVRQPQLFLFDEPLSNLDAKLRHGTRAEIKRLLHRFGITAIYVTHDQVEAIGLGDRVAVMRAGRIEQVGTYQELRQNPANAFVAGFFGRPPMNLFEGAPAPDGTFRIGEASVALPQKLRAQGLGGEAVILGVRPEAARMHQGGDECPGCAMIRGTVEVIEPDFGQRRKLIHVRSGHELFVVAASLEEPASVGEEVGVDLPLDQMYFFYGEDGRSVAAPGGES
jgi:ABC-type sugar transport system ATPase subunit